MSSKTSTPELSSEHIAEETAPIAQPEASDSAKESISDASSTDSLEQKTDSKIVSPTQDVSTSGYVETSETGSGLSEVTLPRDESESVRITAEIHSEGGSGSGYSSPIKQKSKTGKAKTVGTAAGSSSVSAPDDVKPQPEQEKGRSMSAAESCPSTSSVKSLSLSASRSPSVAFDKSGVVTITDLESPPSTSKVLSPFEAPSDLETESDHLVAALLQEEEEEMARWVVPEPPRFSIPPRSYYVPQPRLFNRHQYTGILGCIVHYLQGWQAYSIFMSDSLLLVPFQIFLIALSISAIVMGSLNLNNCPMAKEIPILILVLGVIGFLAITLRIAFVMYNYLSKLLKCLGVQNWIIIFINVSFLIVFSVELYTFFSNTPSFVDDSQNYCSPVFHTYGQILNYAVSFLVALLFAMHGPAFLFNRFNIGGPGIPTTDE